MNREQLLSSLRITPLIKPVSDVLGGTVHVKSLSVGEMLDLVDRIQDGSPIDQILSVVIACVVDAETGEMVFTERDRDTLRSVQYSQLHDLSRIASEASRFNGMSKEGESESGEG